MCIYYVEIMCAGRIGLGWAHDVFTVAYHMLMHFSCICTFYSLSLSLSLQLAYSMAPKHKSTLSWNPLHFGAVSSFPSADPTPSHVWFRNKKARMDFSENFFRRGIHLERQVILSDFSDTALPTVIYNRGLESLCDISVTCPSMII